METRAAEPVERAPAGKRDATPMPRRGIGLGGGLLLALALLSLVALPLLATALRERALRRELAAALQSQGEVIATSLANAAIDLILSHDAPAVQALVNELLAIEGVAYLMVYSQDETLIAHTFAPFMPADLVRQNTLAGQQEPRTVHLVYRDPASGQPQRVIDIGVPILAGELGVARVGMNEDRIGDVARAARQELLLPLAVTALLAALFGLLFLRRLWASAGHLRQIAETRGDALQRAHEEIAALGRETGELIGTATSLEAAAGTQRTAAKRIVGAMVGAPDALHDAAQRTAAAAVVARQTRAAAENGQLDVLGALEILQRLRQQLRDVTSRETDAKALDHAFAAARQASVQLKEIAASAGNSLDTLQALSQAIDEQASLAAVAAAGVNTLGTAAERGETAARAGRQQAEKLLLLTNDLAAGLARTRSP